MVYAQKRVFVLLSILLSFTSAYASGLSEGEFVGEAEISKALQFKGEKLKIRARISGNQVFFDYGAPTGANGKRNLTIELLTLVIRGLIPLQMTANFEDGSGTLTLQYREDRSRIATRDVSGTCRQMAAKSGKYCQFRVDTSVVSPGGQSMFFKRLEFFFLKDDVYFDAVIPSAVTGSVTKTDFTPIGPEKIVSAHMKRNKRQTHN